MKGIFEELAALFKKPLYTASVVITALVGYGYNVTHEALGIDDITADYYLASGLFTQRRFACWLTQILFPQDSFGAIQCVGLILAILGAALFCVWMKRVSEGKLSDACYPVFSCLLISYPLIAEAWVYDGLCVVIGMNFILCALALLCVFYWFQERRWVYPIVCTLAIAYMLSNYEAFVSVYICGVFMYFILRWRYGEPAERSWKTILLRGLQCVVPLALYVVCWRLSVDQPRFQATWIGIFLRDMFVKLAVNAKWYLPIAIFDVAALIAAAVAVCLSIRQKKTILFLFAGFILSPVSLQCALRTSIGYRTMIALALFVAFVGVWVVQACMTHVRKAWLRRCVICGLAYLICVQAMSLNSVFRLNVRAFNEETTMLRAIACQVTEEYGCEKPVEFVGEYRLSEAIMADCSAPKSDPVAALALRLENSTEDRWKYIDTAVPIVTYWGLNAFDMPNVYLIRLCNLIGIPMLHTGTAEMYYDAKSIAEDMPAYPAPGYMAETDDFIVIKLGKIGVGE